MRREAICAAMVLLFLLVTASFDVSAFSGAYPAAVLAAVVIGAGYFAMAKGPQTGVAMANSDKGGDAVEWEGFGQKAKVPTKALTGANLLIVGMFIVILIAQWQMFALLGKVVEALDRNTYMLSLNQADREAMRPMMPQSFQRFRSP